MHNLYKSFDIPNGLTGKINDFRGLFNQNYLEHHGFHVKTVDNTNTLPMEMEEDYYCQYSIDTVKGEFIVGKSNDTTKDQPLVTYLGNGKWDISEKVSDKDERQKEVSGKAIGKFHFKDNHGFRNFFLGNKKEKDGNNLTFYGKDDNPDLTQWGPELPLPQLPPFPDEKLQLKEQVSYLQDRNETLENKNAKLEDELSEYRQMLNILSKETLI